MSELAHLPCPMCDSSDAFSYNTEKGVGKCFSCGKGYVGEIDGGNKADTLWTVALFIETLISTNRELVATLDAAEVMLQGRIKEAAHHKATARSNNSKRREHYRMHSLSEALGEFRKIRKFNQKGVL